MAKTKRRNRFFPVLLLTLLVALIYRIILTHIIGSRGIAMFALPNELSFLLGGTLGYGLREAVALMLENRIQRGQYESARRLVVCALGASLLLSVLFALLVLFLAGRLSRQLFQMPLAYLSVLFIVPAIICMALTGVLRGFFEGTGNAQIAEQSDVLFALFYAVSGTVFSALLSGYGQKVSLLLRNESFAYAYGAMGASLGILIASVLSLLHIVVLYFVMKHRTVIREGRDGVRNSDAPLQTAINVLLNALVYMGLFMAWPFRMLFDMALYLASREENALFLWGEYYGKVLPLTGITAIFVMLFNYSYVRKAVAAVYREEYRNAREKLGRMIHRCAGIGIFVSAMLLVLADDLLSVFFTNNGSRTVGNLQLGALAAMLAIFAVLLLEMIILMRYHKLALVLCGIALLGHGVLALIFSGISPSHLQGILIASIVFYALLAVLAFVFVSRAFQYTQEWFRAFAVTIVSALISAVIGMLLNNAIAPLVGKGVAFFVTFLISALLYMLILLALRGYSEEELLQSPVGRLMAGIGRAVHLL